MYNILQLANLLPIFVKVKTKQLRQMIPDSLTVSEFSKLTADAEKKGKPEQKYKLGLMYLLGEGVEQNILKGRHFMKIAAMDGCAQAQCERGAFHLIGMLSVPYLKNSIERLEEATNKGNIEAMFWLGIVLLRGHYKDLAKARELHEKAEQNGLDELYVEIIHKLRDSGAYEEKARL